MKIALSQIHLPIGDLEVFHERASSQLKMAEAQGAGLLCFPAPLLCGAQPGAFAASSAYQSRLVDILQTFSEEVDSSGVSAALVPAPVAYKDGVLFETFYLRNGRAIPLRLLAAQTRINMDESADPWAPICFDLDGVRIALSFDFFRDADMLPAGTDICIHFQLTPFSIDDAATATGTGPSVESFMRLVEEHRIWFACLAPVGLYDDAVYIGGSFVLDDCARLVASASLLEQELIVCGFGKAKSSECEAGEAPTAARREELLWGVLRCCVSDIVASRGAQNVLIELDGSPVKSLLAALAVDALGSRHVVGLGFPVPDQATPRGLQESFDSFAHARAVADALHMRYEEHSIPDAMCDVRRDCVSESFDCYSLFKQMVFQSYASRMNAVVLSPDTKTDYAFGAGRQYESPWSFAPFGDVFLSELISLTAYRNGVSRVIPEGSVSTQSFNRAALELLGRAMHALGNNHEFYDRVAAALRDESATLDSHTIDGFLKEHVVEGRSGACTGLASTAPRAMQALCSLVQRAEAMRRVMPPLACVTSSPLSERVWPREMHWVEPVKAVRDHAVQDLVDYELDREKRRLEEAGQRARQEIAGLIGQFLGLHQPRPSDDGSRESVEQDQVIETFDDVEAAEATDEAVDAAESEEPGIDLSSEESVPPSFRLGGPFFSVN